MKILIIGDIVGSPGREAFKNTVAKYRDNGRAEIIVVNAENSAGGRGLTPKIAKELYDAGADCITLGDHTWDQREIMPFLDQEERIVRPANFDQNCPGKGMTTVSTPYGSITVINLLGRVFLNPMACPFRTVDQLLKKADPSTRTIIVDMHAEATSEKVAMGWHLDGRVSVVVGTHTHVQTSDERILPKGTAYLTDMGMTGAKDSVIGCDIEPVLKKFLTGLPNRFTVASENPACEGVLVEVDPYTGKALSIERIRETFGAASDQ
jgi:metallophosphoesterase (TIGR00282 family)